MEVTAIKLVRLGRDAVVLAEMLGRWVEVIREPYDGCYSHIIEDGGLRRAAAEALAIGDLVDSGGIVDAP